MGNQSSSASSSSSYKRKPRLEKSASCGSGFVTSSNSSEDEHHHPKKVQDCGVVIAEEEGENANKGSFHYNIHQPSDLLKVNNSSNSLLVKRHSTALEFVSSKSPLRDYLKEKLSWNHKTTNVGGGDSNKNKSVVIASPPKSKMTTNAERFAKLLAQMSIAQAPKLGRISEQAIQKHLFPHSPLMASYFWKYLTNHQPIDGISESVFVTTSENMCSLLTDKDQLNFYLKLFVLDDKNNMIEIEAFMEFLICAYQLATVGEPEHLEAFKMKQYNPFDGKEFMESVTKSCYHIKDEMSVCFLSNWLLTNLPRIHILVHKYILHQLTTGYNQLATGNVTINTQASGVTSITSASEKRPSLDIPQEVLQDGNKVEIESEEIIVAKYRLNPVLMWLLRASLPTSFLAAFIKKPETQLLPPKLQAITSAQLLFQLMESKLEPASWSCLYNSDSDGMSINRFQFHVFNYRGPTLMIIKAENGYCLAIASDTEWKESCHFWGNENATLLQLEPEFRIVEKGAKLIYVNFSIRGYPFGIQVGKDPRNVSLDIKPDFSYAHFKKIPCCISSLEVWGCATKNTHVAQAEFKKWEAKQCENERKININSADWKDNPDKFLLELAGNYRSYDHS